MKKTFSLTFFLVVILLAASTSYFIQFYEKKTGTKSATEAHDWIHKQLQLTPEQEEKLKPIEKKWAEQKKHLTELMRLTNMELAQNILEDKTYSTKVATAVEKIHAAQGELQKATLQHVFEMKKVLTSEQYQKLLNLTANALYQLEPKEPKN